MSEKLKANFTPVSNVILDDAIAYRRSGFSVIPIKPKNKTPQLGSWEPYQKEAPSEEMIRHWFESWPDANLALVTGAVSDCVVIDIDTQEAKDKLKDFVGDFDLTSVPRSRTGKGWQLFFKHPQVNVPNRAGVIPGLDVRGDGGYVVAPPSIHPSGKRYEWQVPLNGHLPPLPVDLLKLISTPAGTGEREKFDSSVVWEGIPDGQRDQELFRYACQLRSYNAPREVADRLIIEAAGLCRPPFHEHDALKKVEQAYKYPAGHSSYNSYNSYSKSDSPKPELRSEAFYGLAGEIVRAIEPYSESDPVAILANILAGFGNAIGPTPYARVEETPHRLNLYVVQVGDTSKGRKGTAWSTPRKMFRDVDSEWAEKRVTGGLSSGEGLVYNVRDPRYQTKPIREDGKIVGYEDVLVDKGEDDKRLLLVEEEFSQALKVMSREGNILSPIIRQAWDHGNLRSLTKNDPNRATGAHISIIAHITRGELLRHLVETEQTNGFANRFCWLLVARSKEISRPKGVPHETLYPLTQRLGDAIVFARRVVEMDRDEQANVQWDAIYHELSEAKPGLTGALIARAEAQVLRLSCLYALLDNSEVIRAEHQQAALALWEYSEQSVKAIFGDLAGDPNVDMGSSALRSKGKLTLTEVHALFGRNAPAAEIDRVIGVLIKQGATMEETHHKNGGRPTTAICWTTDATK